MGAAGPGCGEVPRGNSICPQLLGLDRLVPGEKAKNLGEEVTLEEGRGLQACPVYHWLNPCLMLC